MVKIRRLHGIYLSLQHHMVMKLDSKCYLMKLDDTEATQVHDAAGIVEIEVLFCIYQN